MRQLEKSYQPASHRWQGVTVTDVEPQQLRLLRRELGLLNGQQETFQPKAQSAKYSCLSYIGLDLLSDAQPSRKVLYSLSAWPDGTRATQYILSAYCVFRLPSATTTTFREISRQAGLRATSRGKKWK